MIAAIIGTHRATKDANEPSRAILACKSPSPCLLVPELRYGLVPRGHQDGISLLKLFPCFGPVHNVIVRFNNIQKTG